MKKLFAPSTWPRWLAFLLPVVMLGSYFANRHMMPFGNSTILTVDLGQQYVDMFAIMRTTLLHHPETFLYSFSNALGGDMLGLWTYYLMSPLNLILLFFTPQHLPTGILLLTLLKYGLASLAMTWSVQKMNYQTGWMSTSFGVMYALIGWMVAYQLNLLWLDALILLPIIIVGLERLLTTGKYRYFVIPFTLMLVINYYMAYMIAIFLILYWLWRLTTTKLTKRIFWQMLTRFAGGALLSGALAAVILLPTAFQLTLSKGQYTTTQLGSWIEYNPLWMLSKLFLGSFNFAQMPTGQPNIFVASLGMFSALLYFINRDIRWQNRLVASLISLFIIASMCIAPLDLFWHGLQFPVWYPYRFSFIWSFWLLWLGASQIKPQQALDLKAFLFLFSSLMVVVIIVALTMNKTNFMIWPQLLVGLAFALSSLVLLISPRINVWSWLVLLLVITETSTNAIWSLNNFSYLTKGEYEAEVSATHQAVGMLPNNEKHFYRVGQTYMRTKDDPFMHDFYGGSAFTSSFAKKTSDFMGLVGNPSGDNYSVYSNGTLLTDNLLNFKYFLGASTHFAVAKGAPAQMQITQRPDLIADSVYTETPNVTVYQNPQTLPLGFAASYQATSTKFSANQPLVNQMNLWTNLRGSDSAPLFTPINFDSYATMNTNRPTNVNGAFLVPKNLIKPTALTTTFTPTSNDPYYLTIGPNMTPDNVSITLNGRFLHTNDAFRTPVVLAITSHAKNQPQTLVFTLKKASLWLQSVQLYRLNETQLGQETKQLAANPWHLSEFNQRKMTGSITTTAHKPLLMTTIPQAPGWHATVDGRTTKTLTIANMFLAVKLTPGKHTVTLAYTPPYLLLGATISLLGLLVSIGYIIWQRQKTKKAL